MSTCPCAASTAGTGGWSRAWGGGWDGPAAAPFPGQKSSCQLEQHKGAHSAPCPKPAQRRDGGERMPWGTQRWHSTAQLPTAQDRLSWHCQRCRGRDTPQGHPAGTPRTAIGSQDGSHPGCSAGAPVHRSSAALRPRRRCDLQSHRATVLLGRNSSNTEQAHSGSLAPASGTSPQPTLQTGCAELRLLCSPGGSGPNSTWASSGQNAAVTSRAFHYNCMCYKDSPVFDTKLIIKSYFC